MPVWRGLELGFDDVLRAEIIQQLMCSGEIDVSAIERRFEVIFRQYFADIWPQLSQLAEEGLLTLERKRIAATARGRYLLRSIAMCFDQYLQKTQTSNSAVLYSKAI